MLSAQFRQQVEVATQNFWNKEIRAPFFTKVAQGSEIGHRIADFVSDKTTTFLAGQFPATFQRNQRGGKVPRSMGDIWLKYKDIYHPVNVKTSIAENGGQPNMVSLKKLLVALLEKRIDSYYLLFIKISRSGARLSVEVHFVDMLDYLPYVTFDSGPGQVMLRSSAFFEAREHNHVLKEKSLSEKVSTLIALLEDGERRLVRNRRAALAAIKKSAGRYNHAHHIVKPEAQVIFNLQ
ncbi:MAG: hypothetical protein HYT82_02150 [Candidatus Harrisonbacteria bacterium]|nr:hypothetical protein [Candidatus Harrisonbacteria bacterium]